MSPRARGIIHTMADWILETGLYLLGLVLIAAAAVLLVC